MTRTLWAVIGMLMTIPNEAVINRLAADYTPLLATTKQLTTCYQWTFE